MRAFYCARNKEPLPLADVVIEDDLAHDGIVTREYPLDWGFLDWSRAAERLIGGSMPQFTAAAVHQAPVRAAALPRQVVAVSGHAPSGTSW